MIIIDEAKFGSLQEAVHSLQGTNYIILEKKHTTVVNQQTGLTTSLFEAALLQLDFPAFLRERTRAATPCGEAIGINVPMNAIALTSLGASGNLINGRGKGRVSDSE
jgi:hypothetical protein